MWKRHAGAIAAAALAISVAGTATFAGTVGGVVDGDDLCLCGDDPLVRRHAGRTNKCDPACVQVRLCGIDAPEPRQPGGPEARQKLGELTAGKEVQCTHVGNGTVCDRRSPPFTGRRPVAQCFADGRDIARDMVETGHACDWTRFSAGHYSRNGVGKPCPDGHRDRRRRAK